MSKTQGKLRFSFVGGERFAFSRHWASKTKVKLRFFMISEKRQFLNTVSRFLDIVSISMSKTVVKL